MTSLRVLAFLGLSTLGLVACTKKIDGAKLEEAIKTGIQSQVKGADLKSIKCPADQEAKVGATFECKAEDKDGTAITVTVTVKTEDGNVDWKITGTSGGPAPSATPAAHHE